MIALAFSLAALLLLMLQLLACDTLAGLRRLRDDVEADFGHDTKIYPDHTP